MNYISQRGTCFESANMSVRSTASNESHSTSSSSDTMASVTLRGPQHPFLTPGRASTISSWTTSLPGQNTQPHSESVADAQSREAAVEAYRQLKLALFSKASNPISTKSP